MKRRILRWLFRDRDHDREIEGVVITVIDVTTLTRAETQQKLLIAELQHRTRNVLAVVRSVVARTIRGSAGLDDFRTRIGERLGALARIQGLLSQRGERRITFDTLLRAELNAHLALDADGQAAQVTTTGPPGVPLYSANIQIMALALHELMTNAIKYGALANPAGHLEVNWRLGSGDAPHLLVEWLERGVARLPAPGDPPIGSGYGRELIERALPYQLHAETSYAFTDDGVRCTIEVPVAREPTGGAA